jgi:hypothetical protein
MAPKTPKGKAARKDAAKTAKSPDELANALVGKDYVASDFDVSRDREDGQKGKFAKRVQGGRLLDDIDEELSDDEIESLTAAGVIRKATIEDARATLARDAAEEAKTHTREHNAARNEVTTRFAGERAAVRAKHDAARDTELGELDKSEAEELAAVDEKAAAGGE